MKKLFAILYFVFPLLVAVVGNAQVGTGSISGSVSDSSGAALPHASVVVRNTQTGVTLTFETDSDGRYTAPSLTIGQYNVEAQKEGFQRGIHKDISLTVGRAMTVDFQLPVGQVTEQVMVEAGAATIDTVSSNVGTLVGQKEMRELPLNGRNYQELILLSTGVQSVATEGGGSSSFSGRSSSFSVAGGRPEGQAVLLDGARIQGFWNNGAGSNITGTSMPPIGLMHSEQSKTG